jgi:hypothetical protein
VLAAQQFWLVAVLPTFLVAMQQVRSYRRWRGEQHRLDRQWRQQQAEAWRFPFKEPSSSNGEGSSSGNGDSNGDSSNGDSNGGGAGGGLVMPPPLALVPLSAQLPLAYRRQLEVRRMPPRNSAQSHHPEDWQWALAERALRALRPTYALTAVLLLAAAMGGAWHQQAFP